MKNLLFPIILFFAVNLGNLQAQAAPNERARSKQASAKHADPTVAANIKMYTETWDAIINEGRFDLFNAEHFCR